MENKNNLYLLGIVAVVAIAAIVIMVQSSKTTLNVQDNDNQVGQASLVASTPKTINITTCYDSDNGKNYYVKGTISLANESFNSSKTDFCRNYNSSVLVEYYCYMFNSTSSENYNCPYGCRNGACIQKFNGSINTTINVSYKQTTA